MIEQAQERLLITLNNINESREKKISNINGNSFSTNEAVKRISVCLSHIEKKLPPKINALKRTKHIKEKRTTEVLGTISIRKFHIYPGGGR